MKFRVGDQVIVTAGKNKGVKAEITQVIPRENKVILEGVNLYSRHIKKQAGREGEIVRKERPLHTASIAIINDQGQPDRIGYKMSSDGKKIRIYRKTGKVIENKSRVSTKETST